MGIVLDLTNLAEDKKEELIKSTHVMASSSSSTGTVTQDNLKEQDTNIPTLKLNLKLKKEKGKKIQWTEDTVDNEGLGKKKSKCCCQFRKARTELEESSSEEEEGCEQCPGH